MNSILPEEKNVYADIRLCGLEDLDEIVKLQELVIENMPNAEQLARTEIIEFEESLRLDKCYAAELEGEMIAFSMMVVPRVSYRNNGNYLGFNEQQLLETVTFDLCMVKPGHRGRGLQSRMLDVRIKDAKDLGAKYAVCTVDPENIYSKNNLIKHGFEVADVKELYGGHLRNIMKKEL